MTVVNESIVANGDDGIDFVGFTGWYDSYPSISQGVGGYSALGGWRFQTVAVPQGATINSATITLTFGATSSGHAGRLFGQDVDDAAVWASGGLRPSNMTKTTAYATLSAATGSTDDTYQVDVASIVQEIVNRAGWASGNDMAFGGALTGATRNALFYDYGTQAAKAAALAIDYTAGSSGAVSPPAADIALAALAPTVTGNQSGAVTVPAADIAVAASAPTVTGNQSASVSPPAADIAVAALAPTVTGNGSASVTPPAGQITVAALAPTVTAGAAVARRRGGYGGGRGFQERSRRNWDDLERIVEEIRTPAEAREIIEEAREVVAAQPVEIDTQTPRLLADMAAQARAAERALVALQARLIELEIQDEEEVLLLVA